MKLSIFSEEHSFFPRSSRTRVFIDNFDGFNIDEVFNRLQLAVHRGCVLDNNSFLQPVQSQKLYGSLLPPWLSNRAFNQSDCVKFVYNRLRSRRHVGNSLQSTGDESRTQARSQSPRLFWPVLAHVVLWDLESPKRQGKLADLGHGVENLRPM